MRRYVGLETSLTKKVRKYLEEHYPDGQVRKRLGTVAGIRGDPDLCMVVQGAHLEIEVKVHPNAPYPLQVVRMEQWEKAGAHVTVVYSLEELKQWLWTLQLGGIIPPPVTPKKVPKTLVRRRTKAEIRQSRPNSDVQYQREQSSGVAGGSGGGERVCGAICGNLRGGDAADPDATGGHHRPAGADGN